MKPCVKFLSMKRYQLLSDKKSIKQTLNKPKTICNTNKTVTFITKESTVPHIYTVHISVR